MRTTILLCSLFLAANCELASAQTKAAKPPKDQKNAPKVKHLPINKILFEPDSPITIEDSNSIHFYKDNDWVIQGDGTMAETVIDTTVQYTFGVVGCNAKGNPPGCTIASSAPINLPASPSPWYIALYDKSNTKVAVLSFPDSTDPNGLDLTSVAKHKFSHETGGDNGVLVKTDHVASASVCVQPNGSVCAVAEQVVGCPSHLHCLLSIVSTSVVAK